MKKTIFIVAMFLFPFSAHAISDIDVPTMSCSGAETSNLTSFLSLSCMGNLSLAGGSLFSDSKILLTAMGSITLDNLNMTAPNIDLTGDSVVLGSGVSIDPSNSLTIGAGPGGTFPTVNIAPGATISIGGNSYQIIPDPWNSLRLGGSIPIGGSHQFNAGAGLTLYSYPTPVFTIFSPITAVGTVPEPDIISMLPVGVITLAFLTRNRRKIRHSSC